MAKKQTSFKLPKIGAEFVQCEMERPVAQESVIEWLQREWRENLVLAEKCRDEAPDTFRTPAAMCFTNISKILPEENAANAFAIFWMVFDEQRSQLLGSRVARRWGLQDPAELGIGLFVLGRLQLFASVIYLHATRASWLLNADEFLGANLSPNHSATVKDFAAGDLMRKCLGDKPRWEFHYDTDRVIFEADIALWRRDMDLVRRLCDSVPSLSKEPPFYQAVIHWYRSVADDDTAGTVTSLQDAMKTWARIQKKPDIEFAYHQGTAARFRITENISRLLVQGFDTSQKFPWDAGLFEWVNTNPDSKHFLDTSVLSPLLGDLLADLTLPEWLRFPGDRDA